MDDRPYRRTFHAHLPCCMIPSVDLARYWIFCAKDLGVWEIEGEMGIYCPACGALVRELR